MARSRVAHLERGRHRSTASLAGRQINASTTSATNGRNAIAITHDMDRAS